MSGRFAGYCLMGLMAAATVGCGDDNQRPASGATTPSAGGSTAGSAGASGTTAEAGTAGVSGGSAGAAAGDTAGTSVGGMAGGGGNGGTGGNMVDPCQGVTTQGECVSDKIARVCIAATGNADPMLVTTSCRAFEHCDATGAQAHCALNDEACVPNQAACADAKKLMLCDNDGAWQSSDCAGACQDSAIGAFCVKDTPTVNFFGTLEYERFSALNDYSEWSQTSSYEPAEGVLVMAGDGQEWLDAALVSTTGDFNIKVPSSPTSNDVLTFFLVHRDPTGARRQLAVFKPNVADGTADDGQQLDGATWSWSKKVSDLVPGTAIKIDEKNGSGAIHVYRRLLQVQEFITEFYRSAPLSLLVWLRPNTAWNCGNCFTSRPIEVDANQFDAQMFIGASLKERSYWSDAVTTHEAGHYTMSSYGASPNEGGQHCVANVTSAGQAWSEGWATGFSSIFRQDPLYYDHQNGGMFWFNLEQRAYDNKNLHWQRATPAAGLLQDMDENEVGAMLWHFSLQPDIGTDNTLWAISSASATKPPFKRGYKRHTWEMADCKRSKILVTGESVPMFADYLDGLACAGLPAPGIDAVTAPDVAYPYPSSNPLCP